MLGLHAADIVVLVVYLVGITAVGLWMARRIHNIADFLMPRRFGKGMMIMHAFGTGTHSDQAVSVAAKSYTNGLSGIWYQWLWLFCTPFYWLIAPLMRRFRALTTADVFEARYNRGVAMLFALIGSLNLMFNIGVMLKGSGAVIAGATGYAVPQNAAILAMTILFVVYGVAGGLSAAIITDFIQGLMTIVFSFILLPFILIEVGGFAGLHAGIADKHMFSLVAPGEIGLFFVVVISFNALVGIVTQPHTMGNCAAGRTEAEGQVGFMVGCFIKRFCTVAWCLTGLAAVVYFSGQGIDPDNIYGEAARSFLPKLLPGLVGIFIATLLASVMSSCDSFMIASAGLFTENVYKRIIVNRPQRHYVWVARIASLGLVGGGVGFAYWLPDVRAGLEIFWKIAPMMGIAFWLGLFWRRMTSAGAWAATLAALGIWFATTSPPAIDFIERLPVAPSARLVFRKSKAPSATFKDADFKDLGALAGRIRDGGGPLETFLREHLGRRTRDDLAKWSGKGKGKEMEKVPDGLRKMLVADLNAILEGKPASEQAASRTWLATVGNWFSVLFTVQEPVPLYERDRFAHVAVPKDLSQALLHHQRPKRLIEKNRRLLELAYGDEIHRAEFFLPEDISDPVGLARRLREGACPVAAHVHGLLSRDARKIIAGAPGAEKLQATLAREFNRLAAGKSIHDAHALRNASLTSEANNLAGKGALSDRERLELNTHILAETLLGGKSEIYLPWQMVFYLFGGALAGIAVSLVTPRVDRKKLDNFYALTRTPVQLGEQITEPCTLPEGTTPAPRRVVLGRTSLEIPIPTRRAVIGFLVGCALVVGIIVMFLIIANVR